MPRLKVSPLKSVESFVATLEIIALDQLVLEREKLKAESRIQKIRAELAAATSDAVANIKVNLSLAESFALEHRDELIPEKRKSSETPNATFGFRLSPGVLKQLNRKWTAEATLDALRAAGHSDLIVVKETLDKDGIKRRFDDDDAALAGVGLRVEQKDEFWVEPKRDQPAEKRLTA